MPISENPDLDLVRVGRARPALAINPPAFVRHVCFRTDLKKDRDGENASALAFIQNIRSQFKPEFSNVQFEENFQRDMSYVINVGIHKGYHVRIVYNYYSEYRTLTFVIDDPDDCIGQNALSDSAKFMQIDAFVSESIQRFGLKKPD